MGAQGGKSRGWGGLRWQGWRSAGSPGSPRQSGAAAAARPELPGGAGAGAPRRTAGQLHRALSLAGEHLGVTAASRAAAVSPAHASEREASRHLVADL